LVVRVYQRGEQHARVSNCCDIIDIDNNNRRTTFRDLGKDNCRLIKNEQYLAPLFLGLLLGFCAPKIVNASIGSDEFCSDNPGHYACDGKVGNQDDDEDENDNDRECENPPTAASCNNGVDARGVGAENDDDNEKFNEPSGCYRAGYDDGRAGPFDSEVYHDNCTGERRYYDGFIDGCMSVSGITKDVCEGATDA
jgi:hypothetical protein